MTIQYRRHLCIEIGFVLRTATFLKHYRNTPLKNFPDSFDECAGKRIETPREGEYRDLSRCARLLKILTIKKTRWRRGMSRVKPKAVSVITCHELQSSLKRLSYI